MYWNTQWSTTTTFICALWRGKPEDTLDSITCFINLGLFNSVVKSCEWAKLSWVELSSFLASESWDECGKSCKWNGKGKDKTSKESVSGSGPQAQSSWWLAQSRCQVWWRTFPNFEEGQTMVCYFLSLFPFLCILFGSWEWSWKCARLHHKPLDPYIINPEFHIVSITSHQLTTLISAYQTYTGLQLWFNIDSTRIVILVDLATSTYRTRRLFNCWIGIVNPEAYVTTLTEHLTLATCNLRCTYRL